MVIYGCFAYPQLYSHEDLKVHPTLLKGTLSTNRHLPGPVFKKFLPRLMHTVNVASGASSTQSE
jgi:hypothetical protein